MSDVTTTTLRTRFAAALSELYGLEVPAYRTLVEVSHRVNRRVLERDGAVAERLGDIARVTAERHGAIRVGNRRELGQVGRVFAALGMAAVGTYDLRDAAPRPIPVVSTAFRPITSVELARNPFRVFTSVLVAEDRRFFGPELAARIGAFLDARELFGPELLELADAAVRHGGLAPPAADRFIELATGAFALSRAPIDRDWYAELERISDVAADIAGVASTHVNHLTPRVLDIDELYRSMQDRGITMIDRIQGPPRWEGPDVLLRQTSFRALAEPRTFVDAAGHTSEGSLRVRFGEVEARGIALTAAGRALYDRLTAEVDTRLAAGEDADRQDVAAQVWAARLPATETGLWLDGLTHATVTAERPRDGTPPRTLPELRAQGWLVATPIVYEDFLPGSAAGIFASNLTGAGSVHGGEGPPRPASWFEDAIGAPVLDPQQLYAEQADSSLRRALAQLGVPELGPAPLARDASGAAPLASDA